MGIVVLSCDPTQRECSFRGKGRPAGSRRVCFKTKPSLTPAAERPTEPGHLNAARLKRETQVREGQLKPLTRRAVKSIIQ